MNEWSGFQIKQCPSKLDLPLFKQPQGPTKETQLEGLTKEELRPILIQLLQREDEVRLAAATQHIYRSIGDSETQLPRFTEELQIQVCQELHVDPKIGVQLIRSAVALYPEDEEIKGIPHYVRFNRCKEGVLCIGDTIPDCSVVQLDGSRCNLLSLIDIERPAVILAASHT